MKKMFLKVIALVLVMFTMQYCFVPAASAVSSADAKPLPIVAQQMVTNSWHDGVFCGITQVNGHDYIALPIYGGKMYIYDLDDRTLIDEVQTDIATPRGATVDSDGNIWVTGDAPHLYCYNPFTNTGSSKSYADTIESGSAFAITQGDDGDLYFGTYPNGDIAKYNIATDTFTKIDYTESTFTDASVDYATAIVQKGDYIYASMHDDLKNHYLVKLDAATYETVDYVQVNDQMGTQRYLRGLQMMDENIIVGSGTGCMFAVNTDTMTILTADDLGMEFSIKGDISEVKNNKVYFTDDKQGVCQYDLTTKKVSVFIAGKGLLGQRCNSGSFVTLDNGEEEREYFLVYYNSKQAMFGVDVENGTANYAIKNLIAEDAGAGNGLRTLIAGTPGSNELYIGAFDAYQAYVYDTAAEALTEKWTTATMQTDAFHWGYNGKLYAGNYTLCQLIEMDLVNNEPTALFSLNDDVFDQARIHTITSGDNKVFAATIPDVYKNGGMIAWYDYSNNRAYAAVGPNPEDVYYSDNSELAIDTKGNVDTDKLNEVVWINEVTGQERTADIADSNGVNGVITKHSINCIAYYDGILFGTSSRAGGTSAGYGSGRAVLFAYDVAQRKLIATNNLSSMGFGALNYIGGIAEDPEVPGKFWGVAAETLFSFTFNKSTNKFTFKEELSFSKTKATNDGNRYLMPRPILFAGDYIYVGFNENGNLCKIEKANPQNYEKLLPDTQDITEIPYHYALADDGSLYYLSGPDLYMINPNPTEEEWQAAEEIDAMVDNVGQLSMEDIITIRASYAELTNREKSLVQNAAKLSTLEIDMTIAKIDAISTVTKDSGAAIEAARAAYDGLSWQQASQITNYEVLLEAENAYNKLLIVELAKADGSTVLYSSVENAVKAAVKGEFIKLHADVAADAALVIPAGVTLDLNGHTLTAELLVAMNGAIVTDGAECTGGGLLKIAKENLKITQDNSNVIPVWNGNDGYIFTKVTFQQVANTAADGAVQYIFLPSMSNSEAAALLADGGLDNGLKIEAGLSWNNGQSEQFYTYSDELVKKVFDGTNQWVFNLQITGVAGIDSINIGAIVVADCGAQGTAPDMQIVIT